MSNAASRHLERYYVSLDPVEGVRHLALEQWNAALRQAGHEVAEHALRRVGADSAAIADALASSLARRPPAALFAALPLCFTVPGFFARPEVAAIPTVLFWFDDPYRSLGRWAGEPGFLDALRLPHVHHFVWDGYWRQWLAEKYGIASRPIHLAADPAVFHPLPEVAGEGAVFIGTLVSAAHLEAQRALLPPVLAKVARQVEAAIAEAQYGISPFLLLEERLAALPPRLRDEAAAMGERDPAALLTLRGLAWKWGKNQVRRRMLRAALEAAPVTVFSGNLEQTQAGPGELEALAAGAPHPLRFHDTGSLSINDLNRIYARGAVHLQATDPQSVAGGIPFRVFQTTACARPLLTDVKPELLECYREGAEIACYRTVEEIGPRLRHLLDHPGERRALAEAGRVRFLAEHTWAHRVAEVLGAVG